MNAVLNLPPVLSSPPCPCCGVADTLRMGERRVGRYDGRLYDLRTCSNCTATISFLDLVDVLTSGTSEQEQEESSRSFYAAGEITASEVADHIEKDQRVAFLIERYPDVPRRMFCDFGAGTGYVAGSALEYFDRSIAVDFCMDTLLQTVPLFPEPRRVDIARTLPSDVRVDALCLFHVIEHMPNMYETLSPLIGQLSRGGALFFQVPLLRTEYLTRTHYAYLNTHSVEVLCNRLGLIVVGVWFDHNADFMTAIAYKH